MSLTHASVRPYPSATDARRAPLTVVAAVGSETPCDPSRDALLRRRTRALSDRQADTLSLREPLASRRRRCLNGEPSPNYRRLACWPRLRVPCIDRIGIPSSEPHSAKQGQFCRRPWQRSEHQHPWGQGGARRQSDPTRRAASDPPIHQGARASAPVRARLSVSRRAEERCARQSRFLPAAHGSS